jgi:site-specific recombinase XerD
LQPENFFTETLGGLVAKYLDLQVKSGILRPLSIRSYALDLRQAFELDVHGDLEFSSSSAVRFTSKGTQEPSPNLSLDASSLKNILLKAQKNWGHLKPASRHRKTATLKSFCLWLYQNDLTPTNLGDLLHFPKVPRRLPTHLSVDEVLTLIQHLEKEVQANPQADLRPLVLVLLLYGGGLRISEALSLTPKNLDLVELRVGVQGKGGKFRWVPLPEKIFRRVHEAMTTPDFWHGATSRHGYQWVKDAGQRAGLHKQIHPHALRHSYATHLLSSGGDLRTLQELLGHASLTATERYTHLSLDHLANTLEDCHPLSSPESTRKD